MHFIVAHVQSTVPKPHNWWWVTVLSLLAALLVLWGLLTIIMKFAGGEGTGRKGKS